MRIDFHAFSKSNQAFIAKKVVGSSTKFRLTRHNMSSTSLEIKDKSFPWKMAQVAAMLSHPNVNGRNKLFKFLREQGILDVNLPLQEYIDLGYFSVDYNFEIPYSIWSPPRIRVSVSGVEFIKKLVSDKYGEYDKPQRNTRRKPGQLTNINTLLK